EKVALAFAVVLGIPVSPDDVVAACALDQVRPVMAEQLVIVGSTDALVTAAVVRDPEDARNLRPPLVADLVSTARGLAPQAWTTVLAGFWRTTDFVGVGLLAQAGL